jgi:hypothetical protein
VEFRPVVIAALLILAASSEATSDNSNKVGRRSRTTPSVAGKLSVGMIEYIPALDELRDDLISDGHGALINDSDRSLFLSFSAPDPKHRGLWIDLFYSNYGGESEDAEYRLDLHNVGMTYLALIPSDYIIPSFGVGANIIYMRRNEELTFFGDDITHNDWLWGLNGQAGLCLAPLPWIGVDVRYVYQWSKQSTLGGSEFDLGDGSAALSISLMF